VPFVHHRNLILFGDASLQSNQQVTSSKSKFTR